MHDPTSLTMHRTGKRRAHACLPAGTYQRRPAFVLRCRQTRCHRLVRPRRHKQEALFHTERPPLTPIQQPAGHAHDWWPTEIFSRAFNEQDLVFYNNETLLVFQNNFDRICSTVGRGTRTVPGFRRCANSFVILCKSIQRVRLRRSFCLT